MIGKQPDTEACSRGYPLVPAQPKPPTPCSSPQPHTQLPPHPIPVEAPTPWELPGRTVLDEEDAPVPADAVGPPARQVQPVDVLRHGCSGGGLGRRAALRRQEGRHPPRRAKGRLVPPRSKHLLSSDLPPRLCWLQITKEGGKKKKKIPTKPINLTLSEPGCHPACETGFRGHPPSTTARLSK